MPVRLLLRQCSGEWEAEYVLHSQSQAFRGQAVLAQGQVLDDPAGGAYRGYTLKEITLVPAPERPPVEWWQPIQSGSERALLHAKDVVDNHRLAGPRSPQNRDWPADALASVLRRLCVVDGHGA